MLNEMSQKDWTLKLFIHNFLKENGLKNSVSSYEEEVLHTSNFNHELPIKSNKTFLLEWWNMFFTIYSERFKKDFVNKNLVKFPKESLSNLSMNDLLKQNIKNFPLDSLNNMEINNLIANSLKNLPRSNFLNGNFPNQEGPHQPFGQPQKPSIVNLKQALESENTYSLSPKNGLSLGQKIKSDHRIFTTNPVKNNLVGSDNSDMTMKKRKRYIKNNKFVYVHPGSTAAKKLEKEELSKLASGAIVKEEELNSDLYMYSQDPNISVSESSIQGKKRRGSRYRGVSRNGNQWQVLIMVNKKKRYVGSYSNEEEAARAYDKVALQNHGTRAKTNFDYQEEEVKKILQEPPLLKVNIN